MSGVQTTRAAVGAHLVGGIQADSAEEAMRAVAGTLGRHAYAITDGETGPRKQWIFSQLQPLQAIDGIRLAGTKNVYRGTRKEGSDVTKLEVDPSVTELPRRVLGYADAAEASYEIFTRLRAEGVIPAGIKFQVSLPTPLAPVAAFVAEDDQERFYAIYAKAMANEIEDIINSIPAENLMIQLDIALELAVLTGAQSVAPGKLSDKVFMIDEIRRLLALVPTGVEHGIHLCYGDFGHSHFAAPQDLSLCVEFANALTGAFDFVHMPVDRETGLNPAYHEPLRNLTGDGRLALGVIDFRGDEQRTRDLYTAAASIGREFAVAAECGMARLDEGAYPGVSLQTLLQLHALIAEPIR
jgi:hypothetical protein